MYKYYTGQTSEGRRGLVKTLTKKRAIYLSGLSRYKFNKLWIEISKPYWTKFCIPPNVLYIKTYSWWREV